MSAAGVALGAHELAPWCVVAGSGVLGAGMGLGVTSSNVVGQERVGFRQRGAATALLQFSRTMGGTLLVSVLGVVLATILDRQLAHVAGAPEPSLLVDPDRVATFAPATLAAARGALADALVWVFAGTAAVGAVAFVISLRFPAIHPDEEAPRRG